MVHRRGVGGLSERADLGLRPRQKVLLRLKQPPAEEDQSDSSVMNFSHTHIPSPPLCRTQTPPHSNTRPQNQPQTLAEASPSPQRRVWALLPDEAAFQELQLPGGVAGPVLLHVFEQTALQHKGVAAAQLAHLGNKEEKL